MLWLKGDRQCRESDQEDLDGADDVHRRGDGRAEVEENANRAAELGAESSRDHEIRSAAGDDTVGRDSTHGHGRGHRLDTHIHHSSHTAFDRPSLRSH